MMRPLSDWPLADRRHIVGVMTDIDDTLTTEGAITPDALHALASLREAGLPVIAITGRPVGWSERFAATWPVQAVVVENGAVALVVDHEKSISDRSALDSLLSKRYRQDEATRARHFARMQAIALEVMRAVPGAVLAQDSPGRETDIAFDHSEFAHLSQADMDRVVALLQAEGLTVTVSSIHINAWFGEHNKWTGARWIVRELHGRDLSSEADRWAYIGDSTNDQVMFQHFKQAFGVANVRRFESQLLHKPRYVTPSERGAGFAEFSRHLLEAR